MMDRHINYLTLHQNVFHKSIVLGKGVSESKNDIPTRSKNGWYLFINGISKVPSLSKTEESYKLGTIYYPDLMIGMPSCGGSLEYYYVVTEHDVAIIIRLRLDEEVIGESEFAEDVAALAFRDRIPAEADHMDVISELLTEHLVHFLKDKSSIASEIKVIEEEAEVLIKVLDDFFRL
jgi:hypothetical protein